MKHRGATNDSQDVAWVRTHDVERPIYHGPLAAGMGLVVAEYVVEEYDSGDVWVLYITPAGKIDHFVRGTTNETLPKAYLGEDREGAWRVCIGSLLNTRRGDQQIPRSGSGFIVEDLIQMVLT